MVEVITAEFVVATTGDALDLAADLENRDLERATTHAADGDQPQFLDTDIFLDWRSRLG